MWSVCVSIGLEIAGEPLGRELGVAQSAVVDCSMSVVGGSRGSENLSLPEEGITAYLMTFILCFLQFP